MPPPPISICELSAAKGTTISSARYPDQIIGFEGAPTSETALDFARELTSRVVEDFRQKKVDRVVLVYNEFLSAITQEVRVHQLLPVEPPAAETGAEKGAAAKGAADSASSRGRDFLFEPSKESLSRPPGPPLRSEWHLPGVSRVDRFRARRADERHGLGN